MHLVDPLCASFPQPEFYVSPEAARRAVLHSSQFNVIHPTSGLKLDLIVPADDAFNRSRWTRGRTVQPAPDLKVSFASPEDVIVMKLEFYRRGGSDKHLRDIVSVLRVSGDAVDRSYIASWADRLGLNEPWGEVLQRIG